MRQGPPPECVIEVDDEEISDLYPALVDLTVETRRKGSDQATLVFEVERDGRGHWSIQDDARIEKSAKVEISVEFGSRGQVVITGEIVDIKLDLPADMGAAKLTVKVQDETVLLEREHVRKRLSSQKKPRKDKQIISQIASQVDLGARIPVDGLTNESLSQDETAAAFITKRAAANGFEFYVREGELYFGPPELDGKPQGTIKIYAGPETNCLSFSAQRDAKLPDELWLVRPPKKKGQKPKPSRVVSDLPLLGQRPPPSKRKGEPFKARMNPTGGTEPGIKAAAAAKANELAWKLKAQGELDGALFGTVLRPYGLVEVDGAGELLDGNWYVDAVRHRFSSVGWRQNFQLLRNAVGPSARKG